MNLMFDESTSDNTFSISLVNDVNVVESDESFTLQLSSEDPNAVIGSGAGTATVTISEDSNDGTVHLTRLHDFLCLNGSMAKPMA